MPSTTSLSLDFQVPFLLEVKLYAFSCKIYVSSNHHSKLNVFFVQVNSGELYELVGIGTVLNAQLASRLGRRNSASLTASLLIQRPSSHAVNSPRPFPGPYSAATGRKSIRNISPSTARLDLHPVTPWTLGLPGPRHWTGHSRLESPEDQIRNPRTPPPQCSPGPLIATTASYSPSSRLHVSGTQNVPGTLVVGRRARQPPTPAEILCRLHQGEATVHARQPELSAVYPATDRVLLSRHTGGPKATSTSLALCC